jgi:large subunit ribosomal protein L4
MTIEKFIEYEIKDWTGQNSKIRETLKLKISEDKANSLIHKSLIKQQTEHRQGTASTKTKSEVRGGGRKPWQQKGRGRARAGSTRSPLWKGGGVTFGPKPKTYKLKLNKKEWKLSFQTLFYNKKENTIIVDNFNPITNSYKTKNLVNNLNKLIPQNEEKILIVLSEKEQNLILAARNIPTVSTVLVNSLNIKSLLESKKIIMSTNTLKKIEEIYCG